MKKILCVILSLIMVLGIAQAAFAANEETALESGDRHIGFSNGYIGYCLDADVPGADAGDFYTDKKDTSFARNKSSGNDISQPLKILFTQHFESIYARGDDGSYYVLDTNCIQSVVWHYSNNYYMSTASKEGKLISQIDSYTGEYIPDNGYSKTLENGDTITFYFTVLTPENTARQPYFAYTFSVAGPHEHDPGEDWETGEDSHWHECECGEKFDEDEHAGGTADCENKAVCEECGEPYGETDPENHTGGEELRGAKEPTTEEEGYSGDKHCGGCGELLEKGEVIPKLHEHDPGEDWETGEDSHWHECECGEKFDEDEHTGGTADCENKAVCEECGEPYGETDPENHTGDEELRGAKEPTTEEEGYSGDKHCGGCGELLEKGEVIPKLHEHNPGEDWETGEDSHWHECECGEKFDEEEHAGGEADCENKAVCEECGEPYGETDPEKHTGDEELRGAKEPTTEEEGYSGDKHCGDCGELLEKGEVIPKLHEHDPDEEWETDEDSHWHECECGEKFDEDEHEYKDGECVVCEMEDPDFVLTTPDTSDNSLLALWVVLMAVSAAAFVLVILRKKTII